MRRLVSLVLVSVLLLAQRPVWAATPHGAAPEALPSGSQLAAPGAGACAPRIAFNATQSGSYQIYSMAPDGSDVRQLTSGADARVPIWSPDCQEMLYMAAGQVWAMHSDGSDRRPIAGLDGVGAPDFSPDGTRVAFIAAWDPAGSAIYVADYQGDRIANPVRLSAYGSYRETDWSPDGSRIMYNDMQSGLAICFVDMQGRQSCLSGLPGSARSPRFSADGTQIVYEQYMGNIRVVNADGSGGHAVPNATGYAASWTTDGRILFNDPWGWDPAAGAELYVINADGTGKTRLTSNGWEDSVGRWCGCSDPTSPTPSPTTTQTPAPTDTPTTSPTPADTCYLNHFTDLSGWIQGISVLSGRCGGSIGQSGSVVYGVPTGGTGCSGSAYTALPTTLSFSGTCRIDIRARFRDGGFMNIGMTESADLTCADAHVVQNRGWTLQIVGEGGDRVSFTTHDGQGNWNWDLRYGKVHDSAFHLWRLDRDAQGTWRVYEDGDLKLQAANPDLSNNYRFLTVEGCFLGGVGEIDSIAVQACSLPEAPTPTATRTATASATGTLPPTVMAPTATPTAAATPLPTLPAPTCTATPTTAPAERYLHGQVTEQGSGRALAGATLRLYRGVREGWLLVRTSTTNDSGRFGFAISPVSATYRITEQNPTGFGSTGASCPPGARCQAVDGDTFELPLPGDAITGPFILRDALLTAPNPGERAGPR